jgi:acyl dehydratase
MRPPIAPGAALPAMALPGISAAAVTTYCEVTGDDNPTHRDLTAAAAAGFPDLVVPGMLVAAQVERLIAAWHPLVRIVDMDVRFIVPLMVDRDFVLEARVVDVGAGRGDAVLRVKARCGDATFAVAEVRIASVEPGCPTP